MATRETRSSIGKQVGDTKTCEKATDVPEVKKENFKQDLTSDFELKKPIGRTRIRKNTDERTTDVVGPPRSPSLTRNSRTRSASLPPVSREPHSPKAQRKLRGVKICNQQNGVKNNVIPYRTRSDNPVHLLRNGKQRSSMYGWVFDDSQVPIEYRHARRRTSSAIRREIKQDDDTSSVCSKVNDGAESDGSTCSSPIGDLTKGTVGDLDHEVKMPGLCSADIKSEDGFVQETRSEGDQSEIATDSNLGKTISTKITALINRGRVSQILQQISRAREEIRAQAAESNNEHLKENNDLKTVKDTNSNFFAGLETGNTGGNHSGRLRFNPLCMDAHTSDIKPAFLITKDSVSRDTLSPNFFYQKNLKSEDVVMHEGLQLKSSGKLILVNSVKELSRDLMNSNKSNVMEPVKHNTTTSGDKVIKQEMPGCVKEESASGAFDVLHRFEKVVESFKPDPADFVSRTVEVQNALDSSRSSNCSMSNLERALKLGLPWNVDGNKTVGSVTSKPGSPTIKNEASSLTPNNEVLTPNLEVAEDELTANSCKSDSVSMPVKNITPKSTKSDSTPKSAKSNSTSKCSKTDSSLKSVKRKTTPKCVKNILTPKTVKSMKINSTPKSLKSNSPSKSMKKHLAPKSIKTKPTPKSAKSGSTPKSVKNNSTAKSVKNNSTAKSPKSVSTTKSSGGDAAVNENDFPVKCEPKSEVAESSSSISVPVTQSIKSENQKNSAEDVAGLIKEETCDGEENQASVVPNFISLEPKIEPRSEESDPSNVTQDSKSKIRRSARSSAQKATALLSSSGSKAKSKPRSPLVTDDEGSNSGSVSESGSVMLLEENGGKSNKSKTKANMKGIKKTDCKVGEDAKTKENLPLENSDSVADQITDSTVSEASENLVDVEGTVEVGKGKDETSCKVEGDVERDTKTLDDSQDLCASKDDDNVQLSEASAKVSKDSEGRESRMCEEETKDVEVGKVDGTVSSSKTENTSNETGTSEEEVVKLSEKKGMGNDETKDQGKEEGKRKEGDETGKVKEVKGAEETESKSEAEVKKKKKVTDSDEGLTLPSIMTRKSVRQVAGKLEEAKDLVNRSKVCKSMNQNESKGLAINEEEKSEKEITDIKSVTSAKSPAEDKKQQCEEKELDEGVKDSQVERTVVDTQGKLTEDVECGGKVDQDNSEKVEKRVGDLDEDRLKNGDSNIIEKLSTKLEIFKEKQNGTTDSIESVDVYNMKEMVIQDKTESVAVPEQSVDRKTRSSVTDKVDEESEVSKCVEKIEKEESVEVKGVTSQEETVKKDLSSNGEEEKKEIVKRKRNDCEETLSREAKDDNANKKCKSVVDTEEITVGETTAPDIVNNSPGDSKKAEYGHVNTSLTGSSNINGESVVDIPLLNVQLVEGQKNKSIAVANEMNSVNSSQTTKESSVISIKLPVDVKLHEMSPEKKKLATEPKAGEDSDASQTARDVVASTPKKSSAPDASQTTRDVVASTPKKSSAPDASQTTRDVVASTPKKSSAPEQVSTQDVEQVSSKQPIKPVSISPVKEVPERKSRKRRNSLDPKDTVPSKILRHDGLGEGQSGSGVLEADPDVNVMSADVEENTLNESPGAKTEIHTEDLKETKDIGLVDNKLSSKTVMDVNEQHVLGNNSETKVSESLDINDKLVEEPSPSLTSPCKEIKDESDHFVDVEELDESFDDLVNLKLVLSEEDSEEGEDLFVKPKKKLKPSSGNNLEGKAESDVVGDSRTEVFKEEQNSQDLGPLAESLGQNSSGTSNDELSPEDPSVKEPFLSALGLGPRAKVLDGREHAYTGTLKTVIKVHRSPEKRGSKFRFMVKSKSSSAPNGQDLKDNIPEEEENRGPITERVEYRIHRDANTILDPSTADLTNFGIGNRKCLKPFTFRSYFDLSTNSPFLKEDTPVLDGGDKNSGNKEDSKGHGTKNGENLVIPEKSSSFSIHPGRLCSDVCSYCFGKFGSLDTPCHIAQLKSTDRQQKILAAETHLTADSCLCDACYRHVDRKANCPSYNPQGKKRCQKIGTSSRNLCCSTGCSEQAMHQVRRKWIVKLKRCISKKVPVDVDKTALHQPFYLCAQHYYWVEHYMQCGLCRRRLSLNHMYLLGPEVDQINKALNGVAIPVELLEKIYVCKLCRYFCQLSLRYHENQNISSGNRVFCESYRKKVLYLNDIEVSDSDDKSEAIFPPKNKKKKTSTKPSSAAASDGDTSKGEKAATDKSEKDKEAGMLPVTTSLVPIVTLDAGDYNSSDSAESGRGGGAGTPTIDYSSLAFPGTTLDAVSTPPNTGAVPAPPVPPPHPATKQSAKTPRPRVKVGNTTLDPSTEIRPVFSPPAAPPDQVQMQASFDFRSPYAQGSRKRRGDWEMCNATLQFTKETKKDFVNLQRPYGNYSSFIRHLVLLEKYWRSGDLVLSPSASTRANSYISSIENRIKALDGCLRTAATPAPYVPPPPMAPAPYVPPALPIVTPSVSVLPLPPLVAVTTGPAPATLTPLAFDLPLRRLPTVAATSTTASNIGPISISTLPVSGDAASRPTTSSAVVSVTREPPPPPVGGGEVVVGTKAAAMAAASSPKKKPVPSIIQVTTSSGKTYPVFKAFSLQQIKALQQQRKQQKQGGRPPAQLQKLPLLKQQHIPKMPLHKQLSPAQRQPSQPKKSQFNSPKHPVPQTSISVEPANREFVPLIGDVWSLAPERAKKVWDKKREVELISETAPLIAPPPLIPRPTSTAHPQPKVSVTILPKPPLAKATAGRTSNLVNIAPKPTATAVMTSTGILLSRNSEISVSSVPVRRDDPSKC